MIRALLPDFPAYATPLDKLGWWALRIGCVGVLAFLLLPIVVIVPLSFADSSFLVYPIPGWSLRWYQNLFTSDDWIRAARNSFIVAPLATVIATVLGTLAAVGLARTDFAFKGALMSLLIAPMVVPIVVVGVATYLFFAPFGLVDSYAGLIIVHAALGAPFVLTTVLATLQGFNDNLVRASLSLGANPVTTFFRVTLPVIAPGVISGALFAFATSFDEVVVTLFLAGPEQVTLPRQMFTGIRENITPTIAAVATLLILFTTSLLLVLEWLRGRREKCSAPAARQSRFRGGRARRAECKTFPSQPAAKRQCDAAVRRTGDHDAAAGRRFAAGTGRGLHRCAAGHRHLEPCRRALRAAAGARGVRAAAALQPGHRRGAIRHAAGRGPRRRRRSTPIRSTSRWPSSAPSMTACWTAAAGR